MHNIILLATALSRIATLRGVTTRTALAVKKYALVAGSLLPAKRTLVGLDIGSFAIKILALHVQQGKVRVQAMSIVPLTASTDDGGLVLQTTSEDCRRACAAAGIARGRTAVAVPFAHTFLLQSKQPARLRGAALVRALFAELTSQLAEPPTAQSICFDYARAPGLAHDKSRVLMVLCRAEIVEDLRAVVDGGGLQLTVAEPDLFALERALLPGVRHRHGATVFLDLGHSAMRLAIVVTDDQGDAHVVHRHQHRYGGAKLVSALSRHYAWSEADTRRRLLQGEVLGGEDDEGTEIVSDFVHSLAREVATAVAESGAASFARLQRLWLSGGCTRLPGVVQAISTHVNRPENRPEASAPGNEAHQENIRVHVVQPLHAYSPADCADSAHLVVNAAFTVAAGLALRVAGQALDKNAERDWGHRR